MSPFLKICLFLSRERVEATVYFFTQVFVERNTQAVANICSIVPANLKVRGMRCPLVTV